jgi:hypothetical protein
MDDAGDFSGWDLKFSTPVLIGNKPPRATHSTQTSSRRRARERGPERLERVVAIGIGFLASDQQRIGDAAGRPSMRPP